jgi:hypothetical protein
MFQPSRWHRRIFSEGSETITVAADEGADGEGAAGGASLTGIDGAEDEEGFASGGWMADIEPPQLPQNLLVPIKPHLSQRSK